MPDMPLKGTWRWDRQVYPYEINKTPFEKGRPFLEARHVGSGTRALVGDFGVGQALSDEQYALPAPLTRVCGLWAYVVPCYSLK